MWRCYITICWIEVEYHKLIEENSLKFNDVSLYLLTALVVTCHGKQSTIMLSQITLFCSALQVYLSGWCIGRYCFEKLNKFDCSTCYNIPIDR